MADKDIDVYSGQDEMPDETIDEAVARLVAADPIKHGMTLAQREARAISAAKLLAAPIDEAEEAFNARVREIGGDPDEMMVGNKPRYTMDEFATVKDHLTGETHVSMSGSGIAQPLTADVVTNEVAFAVSGCDSKSCQWSDDPAPSEKCGACGLTFYEWCQQ